MEPPPRDLRLDIVRGWMQLTIFASHAAGSWIGHWLIFGAWGLSDSSEQFVFLSGFTLGWVFARNAARGGWRSAAADMWRAGPALSHASGRFRAVRLAGRLGVALPAGRSRPRLVLHAGRPAARRRGGAGGPLPAGPHGHPADLLLVHARAPAVRGARGPARTRGALRAPGPLRRRAGGRPRHAESRAPEGDRLQPVRLAGAVPAGGVARPEGPAARERAAATALARVARGARPGRGAGVAAVLVRLAPWPAPFSESAATIGKEDLALPRLLHALALALLVAALVPRDAGWMRARPAGRSRPSAGTVCPSSASGCSCPGPPRPPSACFPERGGSIRC